MQLLIKYLQRKKFELLLNESLTRNIYVYYIMFFCSECLILCSLLIVKSCNISPADATRNKQIGEQVQ